MQVYIDDKDISIGELLDCFVIENDGKEKKNLIIDIIGV